MAALVALERGQLLRLRQVLRIPSLLALAEVQLQQAQIPYLAVSLLLVVEGVGGLLAVMEDQVGVAQGIYYFQHLRL